MRIYNCISCVVGIHQCKKAYKEVQQSLKDSPNKVVISLDFSNIQTSPSQKFHELIMVIQTKDEFKLPENLQQVILPQITPPTSQKILVPTKIPPVGVRHRRTKEELGTSRNRQIQVKSTNMRNEVLLQYKKKKLSISTQIGTWKPYLTYLYFITKQYQKDEEGDIKVKQTADYVAWALSVLSDNKVFSALRLIFSKSSGVCIKF